MRGLALIILTSLLLSSCSTGEPMQKVKAGTVVSCDLLDTSKASNLKLEMKCLDKSSTINYHQIKGPILVNVWGSWCKPCEEEMPYFVDLYSEEVFKNKQIEILGIDVGEVNEASGIDFIKTNGMSWPHLFDKNDESKSVFGPGVPVTFFLDQNGDVIYKQIGVYTSKKKLYDDVQKYFKVNL